eukprot:CAMPEP_0119357006 /NCGR_PEP_ID=MMETSP1334-20130426/5481_1 /TAXON_ID=127549 /ORGANISM="Calcidiscus leptoporus, Strain RCC1130" /LENGTH=165 /DNA_ID=CAMNT_0007371153 /DNA_START=210 /DNA_END=704 /DNA_ORIENTATION=+
MKWAEMAFESVVRLELRHAMRLELQLRHAGRKATSRLCPAPPVSDWFALARVWASGVGRTHGMDAHVIGIDQSVDGRPPRAVAYAREEDRSICKMRSDAMGASSVVMCMAKPNYLNLCNAAKLYLWLHHVGPSAIIIKTEVGQLYGMKTTTAVAAPTHGTTRTSL